MDGNISVIDRIPYRQVRPTWGRPAANMTVRYLAHPDLRLAFIQVIDEPEHVFVVSDQPLPASLEAAILVVEQWRSENGQTSA